MNQSEAGESINPSRKEKEFFPLLPQISNTEIISLPLLGTETLKAQALSAKPRVCEKKEVFQICV